MSWTKFYRLGEIAEIERHGIAPDDISTGQSYIGLEHIESGGRIVANVTVHAGELASSKVRFTANHLLYGKLRPYLAKIALPNFEGICSTDILPIRPGPALCRSYLAHFLRQPSMVDYANARATGANLPRLSPNALADFEIPLPPLHEQKRIAAILDQADELRRKRQRAIDRLNQLGQAIFYEMFGDPATNPMGWPIGQIEDLTASTQYGTSGKASSEGSHAILRMSNLTNGGHIVLQDLKFIDFEPNELGKYTVVRGDMLFNRTNSPELVGKTAVYYGGSPIGFAGYLVRLRVNDLAVPEYISAFLNSRYGKATLRNMCKAIVGMANINAQELRKITIALPPVGLQKSYQARVEKIRDLIGPMHGGLTKFNQLFSTLQNRAFTGTL